MAVRPGYKQTEVGVIPEEWEVKRIGSVCKLINGRGFKPYEWKTSGLPIIRIQNLNGSGEFNYFSGFYDKKLEVGPGQLLFAWSGSRGTSFGPHVWRGPYGLLNYHTWKVQVHEPVIGKDFLFHQLRQLTAYIEGWAHGAAALVHVQKWQMEGFEIPLPPTKAEQEAITEALSDADALIESLEQLLTKKRNLKQGVMQELLTGKKRLPGFSHGGQRYRATKFGMMPTDWMPTPLERVAAFITKGSTPTTYGFAWQSEGVLFLRSECVSERGLDLSQSMFISDKAHQVLRRSEVRAGDILMTITGNVGRVVRLGSDFNEANINQHIARIRIVESQVADTFVFHFLSQPLVRRYYSLITTGQAYPQISLTQVRETEVPMPSLLEQIAIAAILSDMDAGIDALETKLAKARQLKEGMMQELLTGRIRLV